MITQKVITATGQLVNGDLTLCEGCVFDFLTIQWDNVNLSQHDWTYGYHQPPLPPVFLTSKLF